VTYTDQFVELSGGVLSGSEKRVVPTN